MTRKAKNLKVTDCHDIIFDEFKHFKEFRAVRIIPMTSILMSSFAVFALKEPSLLAFEKEFEVESKRSRNIKNLFRLEKIPSDTQLRDILDNVDHKQYRQIFKRLFQYLQRAKTLELFEFMKIKNQPHYLISADGTGYFRSEKVSCENCLASEHFDENGKMTIKYGHNMLASSIVHPDRSEVISLYPEAIVRQDGASKNDSEQSAFKRFLMNFKKDHPKLKSIFLLDALYANKSIIKEIRDARCEFIIAVKNTKGLLFNLVKEGEETGETKLLEKEFKFGEKIIKTRTRTFRYRNSVRLHQDKESPYVNFVEVKEEVNWINKKGEAKKEKRTFSFITDILITKENVEKLSEGGRSRWKIENETFNTLKNRGYHFEHNYGHGENNLSYNFILSMFLAFLVDQIQAMSCLTFRKLKARLGGFSYVWRDYYGALKYLDLKDWDDLYREMLGEDSS